MSNARAREISIERNIKALQQRSHMTNDPNELQSIRNEIIRLNEQLKHIRLSYLSELNHVAAH
jgi:hypothetical protein